MRYLQLLLAVLLATEATVADSQGHENRQSSPCADSTTGPFEPVNYSGLPDPFTFYNGADVTTLDDFECRQAEISAIFQQFELGPSPSPPDYLLAVYNTGKTSITINLFANGENAQFSASVQWPTTIPSNGRVPAIIAIGGSSIPIPDGIALVTFDNNAFAQDNSATSRGVGLFYNIFGANHSAGALTAWAWGASRIVDAIEQLVEDSGMTLDPARLGVTGCSRDGKGAFVSGALEPHLALTIPQESGSGGAACRRISAYDLSVGLDAQTAGEIVQENVWLSPNFNTYSTSVTSMPEDHHLLAALVAPRGLFVIENDIEWLGPNSTTGCMEAGLLVYAVYGVPTSMGFSLVGNHIHCALPGAQKGDLDAYINYFLLNSTTALSVVKVSPVYVNTSQWVT